MKDNVRNEVSYERLNALVDDELDRLERQAGELRMVKDLIRLAYRHESPAGGRGRHGRRREWRWMAAAAVALVGIGIGAGWTAHAWQQGDGDTDFSRLVHQPGAVAQVGAADRVVLHVSSSAPERVSAMLEDAEGMLRAARENNRPIAIEILANNTGLDVLRADVPGTSARLAALRAENSNLTLVACGQTIRRLRERGIVVHLLPQTTVAASALDEVVKRIHEGWTYVRT
jgi:intracellular sulfur oxidation DsrE/DsrF family protein